MPRKTRTRIAVVAKLPRDLLDALAAEYDLVEHRATYGQLGGVRVAVTTSMAGAACPLFDSMFDLGLVACQGTGLDLIDLKGANARGIAVAHTPDILTEDVADFAIALMYAATRNIVAADKFVRDGRWGPERMVPSVRLRGKTAGIVGLGKIGYAVATRAAGLGMTVLWHGPRNKSGIAWQYEANLEALARKSDVLILTSPGGRETNAMVDTRILSALGPEGWLVNIARGSVVDEEALLRALESKTISGAGLDVFATEPDINPRFLSLENVALTPHYASITNETRREMIDLILQNIARWLSGAQIPNAATDAS